MAVDVRIRREGRARRTTLVAAPLRDALDWIERYRRFWEFQFDQVGELLWFTLMDSVHHRGQLSVYIRCAGGKVPSIYGPSADEVWM